MSRFLKLLLLLLCAAVQGKVPQHSPALGSGPLSQLGLPNTSYIANTFDSVGRLTSTSLKNSSGGVLDSSVYGLNLAGQRLASRSGGLTYSAGVFTFDDIDGGAPNIDYPGQI